MFSTCRVVPAAGKVLLIAPPFTAWMLYYRRGFRTDHSFRAREQGLHFYAAGHHAAERGGVTAPLSEWLNKLRRCDVY